MQNQLRTSTIPQPKEVTEYFEQKVLSDSYNKFCIGCLENQTTHVIIQLGCLVCETCALDHIAQVGGMSNCYVKSMLGEQWDDYQLKSVALGGNASMFEICREYGIEKLNLRDKTTHESLKWYRRRHMAMMDDMPFDGLKPPKDLDERLNQAGMVAQKTFTNAFQWTSSKANQLKEAATEGDLSNNIKEGATKTFDNIGKGAVNVTEQVKQSNHFKRFVGLFNRGQAPPQQQEAGASEQMPSAPLDDKAEEQKQPQTEA